MLALGVVHWLAGSVITNDAHIGPFMRLGKAGDQIHRHSPRFGRIPGMRNRELQLVSTTDAATVAAVTRSEVNEAASFGRRLHFEFHA